MHHLKKHCPQPGSFHLCKAPGQKQPENGKDTIRFCVDVFETFDTRNEKEPVLGKLLINASVLSDEGIMGRFTALKPTND